MLSESPSPSLVCSGWPVHQTLENGYATDAVPVFEIAAALHTYHPSFTCTTLAGGKPLNHVDEALL